MLTEDQVLTHLRTYLLGVVPRGVEVVQGQANRVPAPKGQDYVVFWPVGRLRLSTNTDTWDRTNAAPDTIEALRPTAMLVQVDVHGPRSADIVAVIETLWRDDHACRGLADTPVDPLYASEPRQLPFIGGEAQYENRWSVELAMQANLIVSTPMQFADTVHADIRAPVGA